MRKFKNVIFGVKFDEDPETIEFLLELDFLRQSTIHLVHMSVQVNYNLIPEVNLAAYPPAETKIVIEHAVLSKLKEIKANLISRGFSGKIDCRCVFTDNIKKGFCQHVADSGADLVVLMPEKKHSLFGSFTHYQLTHTSVPIFVLRPAI